MIYFIKEVYFINEVYNIKEVRDTASRGRNCNASLQGSHRSRLEPQICSVDRRSMLGISNLPFTEEVHLMGC